MGNFLLLSFVLVVAGAAKVDYSGYVVVRAVPQNEEQLNYLLRLGSMVDFWNSPSRIGDATDMMLSPESYAAVSGVLAEANIQHTIHISDVGQRIRDEEHSILERRAQSRSSAGLTAATFDYENYHTFDEIVALVDSFNSTSTLVTKKVIGTTCKCRDIVTAVVSSNRNAGRPIIYIECAMHAREWMAPATCVWILNMLVSNYSSDPVTKKLVDSFDWFITPVSNPDGYAYTWTNDRLWRKNLVMYKGSSCVGVDPNRNFDSNFGGAGSSSDPCSQIYRGPYAFSEAESKAMRDLLKQHRGRVKASLSLHTYSQMWMSPYSYKNTNPPEYSEMYRVMAAGVNALTATSGTKYTYGTLANTLYYASGVTVDYAYSAEGIIYAYTLELRDDSSGSHGGFQMPPQYIRPTATETWNGIKAMAVAILNP